MQIAELWDELVAAALLGTARQPPPLRSPGGPLGDMLARVAPDDPERALLGAAAAVSLARRAGRLPAPPGDDLRAPDPCPPDEAPRVSARAAGHLDAMLRGTHREALPEWLRAAAARGLRAPEELLVPLLELGRTREALRDAILPVLGVRGRWLAAQNPDWEYAALDLNPEVAQPAASQAPPADVWQTGSRAERLALLRSLRRSAPDAARALVESTWASDRADERAALVQALRVGLTMADEPFLEAALADRSGEVRASAADLLGDLPESRLVGRMRERVSALLTWQPGEAPRLMRIRKPRPARIDVRLPQDLDAAMQRDGVRKSAPSGFKGGQKAWWLSQMLGFVSPAHWRAAWGATADEIVAAALASEWSEALIGGLLTAARRWRDAPMLEALQDEVMRRPGDWPFNVVVDVLLPERLEARVMALLENHPQPIGNDHPAFALLPYCQRWQWSRELSLALLDSLRRRVAANDGNQQQLTYLRSLLPSYALYMPPALAEHAATGWPTHVRAWGFWAEWVEQLIAVLHFRRDMLAALAEPGA